MPPLTANPSTIWQVPAYLPSLHSQLTDAAIADAETCIGFKLPAEYLGLLRSQNGGYIRFRLPKSVHTMIFGIGSGFPSVTHVDWSYAREWVTFELDGLVPFDADGNWHLCFDYRACPENPCVTSADVESDQESKIANSFADYLQLLKWDVDDKDFVVPAGSNVDEIKDTIGRRLDAPFEEPDPLAVGYPVHCARLAKPGFADWASPDWIRISPNLVPRGFVRPSDPCYDKLRDLMPGMARRYPQLSDDSLIITMTDAVRPVVRDALREVSIEILPMKDLVG